MARTYAKLLTSRELRQPPSPPPAPGRCRLCLGTLQAGRRHWCDDCTELRWISTNVTRAHDHLVAIHGPRCWRCGLTEQPARWDLLKPPTVLEVEHIRPLWSLNDEERLQLRWWLPFNLQLLCHGCHATKTGQESAMRALWRRTGALV